jgi:phenylalanyl-tRNA synthetase alpha chain
MPSTISADQLARALALRDLSDPAQGPHAMQLLLDDIVTALTRCWRVPSAVIRPSPVVSISDNYDRLGYDQAAITRESRYSRYLDEHTMLRSHTTAGIPGLLSSLDDASDVDRLLVLPGLTYRRDAIDRVHVGEPHQVDLWRIRSAPHLGDHDLTRMIGVLVDAVLPGARWRTTPTSHPYTAHGRQVDVEVKGQWLELAECGLLPRDLMIRCGLDPDRWSGLALGMGLDRALMLRKGIDDIRLLRSSDPRVAGQLLDLAPWRPVSRHPAIRRDLSVVMDADLDEESLGDAVRSALGKQADDLESVELLAVTSYDELPDSARSRLGVRPDQVNALVRLTLRPLSATMTDQEANALRDEVYRAIHVGPVLELINSRSCHVLSEPWLAENLTTRRKVG